MNTSPARIQNSQVEAQPSLVRTDTLKILHEQHQRPDSKRSSAHVIFQNVFTESATKQSEHSNHESLTKVNSISRAESEVKRSSLVHLDDQR